VTSFLAGFAGGLAGVFTVSIVVAIVRRRRPKGRRNDDADE